MPVRVATTLSLTARRSMLSLEAKRTFSLRLPLSLHHTPNPAGLHSPRTRSDQAPPRQPQLKQNHQQPQQAVEELSSLISRLVLSHSGPAPSLAKTLLSHPSKPAFSPQLVDRVLKLLWNDGPKALLFVDALLRYAPSFRPAASTLDHAADIAARLRDRAAVSRFLSIRLNCRHPPPTARTFAVVMERYVNSGKADRAVRLFLSMHRQGCPQDLTSFNTLLDALCKSGRVEKACSLLKTFRTRFPVDTVTYNIIAEGWCRVKRTPKAMETLKEMVESCNEPTITTYNILLKGFFRAGQLNEALGFFKEMKRRSKEGHHCAPDVVSYTTVVHGLGVIGQLEKARKVFDEMGAKGCPPSVVTYNALIQVICKKAGVANAMPVLEEMITRSCCPNLITYNVIIRGLCHAGDMNGAMEVMGRMKREGCKPNVQTYNILMRYWCELGEIENSLVLFREMGQGGNCLPDLDSYNVLISAMFVRKKPEDMLMAGTLVAEMVGNGHVPRRFMFNRVLNGLLLTGNQELARELLRIQSGCRRLFQEIKL